MATSWLVLPYSERVGSQRGLFQLFRLYCITGRGKLWLTKAF